MNRSVLVHRVRGADGVSLESRFEEKSNLRAS
jgi:hypothetical protein